MVLVVLATAGAALAAPPSHIVGEKQPTPAPPLPTKMPMPTKPPPPPPPPVAAPIPVATPTPITRWKLAGGSVANISMGSRGGPTAACVDGRVVTGGYAAMGPTGKVLSKRPAADGSAYLALGENDGLRASEITVTGICIARPTGYTIAQVSRSLAPHARAQVDVTCPAGTIVIGGGASTETGVYLAMSAPKLDGSAWSTYFRSDAIFGNKNADAFAVCAAPSAVAGWEVVMTPPAQLGPGAQTDLSLRCPSNKKALSIGYSVTSTTVIQPALDWLSPETKADPRNHITTPVETWSGGMSNTSSVFENVTVETRLVAICANATF